MSEAKPASGCTVEVIVGSLHDGCMELERQITIGGHIGWQDRKWHLFKACGCSVNDGASTLYDLILSLAPNVRLERQTGIGEQNHELQRMPRRIRRI